MQSVGTERSPVSCAGCLLCLLVWDHNPSGFGVPKSEVLTTVYGLHSLQHLYSDVRVQGNPK